MARFVCSVCGYEYDEAEEGRSWSSLPDSWECPLCGSPKTQFHRADADEAPPAEEPISEEAPLPSEAPDSGVSSKPARGQPGRWLLAHRVFGYVFLAIYLFFLYQMIPRLWTYQIEFPARSVVHMTLGMALGPILLLKILIVRYFRRLDAALVPGMGISMFVCSVVLIGISAPFAFQEAIMERAASAEGVFAAENRQRVGTLLSQTGLTEPESARFASMASLRAGRDILRRQCVECHDLRTVLAKPRTPENWRQTVRRMADRTTALDPLAEEEQWQATAYLVALSPKLQQSTRQLRTQTKLERESQEALESISRADRPAGATGEQTKPVFERKCSECHASDLTETVAIESAPKVRALVRRMVDEGLTATEEELAQIIAYLIQTHVK